MYSNKNKSDLFCRQVVMCGRGEIFPVSSLFFLESFSRSSAVESCQVSHLSLSSGSLESVTERSILFLNSLILTSFSSLY